MPTLQQPLVVAANSLLGLNPKQEHIACAKVSGQLHLPGDNVRGIGYPPRVALQALVERGSKSLHATDTQQHWDEGQAYSQLQLGGLQHRTN
jgi:hypothetical protein